MGANEQLGTRLQGHFRSASSRSDWEFTADETIRLAEQSQYPFFVKTQRKTLLFALVEAHDGTKHFPLDEAISALM